MTELTKRIVLVEDLEIWTDSHTYSEILGFVEKLQNLVVGLSNDTDVQESESTTAIMAILHRIECIIEENPVVHEKDISRFGKAEFKDFYDQVQTESANMVETLTTPETEKFSAEIARYLGESWGDRQRIDYGSGHELNFICFLLCLKKLNIVDATDSSALVLRVFCKYIKVMRQLQKTYWLEPAGSHGVWGLDDYHFLPFLFGAAQLATHPHMKPKLIHNRELVDNFWQKYMYFECIHFINSIKTVPGEDGSAPVSLRWHSPMLDDILSAKSWSKIKDGMIKMYRAEVLGKLPIVQHIMFGELVEAPEGVHEHAVETDECGHVHSETISTWGDCCGIKIPSALAASQMNERRPVPFD